MTESSQNIDREKVLKYKLTKSLEFFIRYFFKEYHGKKFVLNDHHKEIIDALCDVILGKTKRLIINIAPRYGKTEIAVKMFIAYCLAMNSRAKFIHLSYSDTLALDNSEEIKDFIESEEYQRFFNVTIKLDSKSKKKWYTTEGGGVYATAAGGQVTGFGAGKMEDAGEEFEPEDWYDAVTNFGGAIIIDDPIKPDDTESDAIREKINYRFDSTIRSRTNSRNTPIIIIMQRLHPSDLTGYLLGVEPDEWRVLSMPCIKENGEALWPYKHTIEELRHLETVNDVVFGSQYLQDPSPKEGLMFPKDELNYFDPELVDLKNPDSCCSFIDVADKGTDMHCVPFGKIVGNKVFIDDALFTQEGTDKNVGYSIERINLHRPAYCQVEANFGGGMYKQLLSINASPKMNGRTALIDIVAKGNKHVRIQTMAGFIKKFFYFKKDFDRNSEYGKFMINLTEYRKNGGNKHDDAPDAVSGLARMILMYYPSLWGEFVAALGE